MLTLVAIAVMAPPSAELTILTDKEVYASGESIEVDFVLRNKGKTEFSVATTRWDGRLSAVLNYELWCGDKQYWPKFGENSMVQFAQVVSGNEVTSDRFDMLYPGQRVNVGFFNFSQAALAGHTGLKSDPMPVAKDLAPGVYEIRAGYKFVGPFDRYDFTAAAKKMFEMSFRGELKAAKKFRIVAG
jgi:hypothetical protein